MNVHAFLDHIDAQRAAIVAEVAVLSEAAQRVRATDDAWSPLDVIEHLVLAEQVVLGDLDSAPTRMAPEPTVVHRLRRSMVWLVLRLGIRVRIPVDRMRPTGTATFTALRTRWDEQHIALRRLVTGMDRRGLQRHIFRHPIAGPLNTPQALRLLSAHLATHHRQLARLRVARPCHPDALPSVTEL
jgi:hypothetical protein